MYWPKDYKFKKIICCTDKNDHVLYVIPAVGPKSFKKATENESEEDFLTRLAAKDAKIYQSWRLMDREMMPDRYYRNIHRWDENQKKVVIKKDEAMVFHLDKLRKKRNSRLDELDKDLMKAEETADLTGVVKIKALKQKLRDMPSLIQKELDQKANDLEQLKVYEPSMLTETW